MINGELQLTSHLSCNTLGHACHPSNAASLTRMLTGLCSCAVPQQLLPRLLSAGQFKCPNCRTTQGLPEGLGTQQEAQLLSADAQRVPHQPLPMLNLQKCA